MLKQAVALSPSRLVRPLGVLAAILFIGTGALAQPVPREQLPAEAFTIPLDREMPLSPQVTVGRLDNGLRYYIRENKEPQKRAELRLVVNAGSILEADDQRGLAHFLEHMAFNGTEHFPKQTIVSFMESIGMKFGGDLNASTSFDETVYIMQVPTDKPAAVTTALQILEDWTHGLTLAPQDIADERGVVIEEWRRGRGASGRVRDQQIPVLLKDSHYAERLAIGTLDSLEHFEPAALRRFYQDWYRPDLMAVVAVGDFDKADIEKQIRQHFSAIPAAKAAKPRQHYEVPAHKGTRYSIVSDPELSGTQVQLLQLMPADNDWTPGGMRRRMVEGFYNAMLNQRFQEMVRKPDAPFLGAQSGRNTLVRPTSAYMLVAAVQETGVTRGLEALLTESERAKRHGFTQAEFARLKTAMQRSIESGWARRDNRTSSSHADEMIRSFLTGESIPGVEFETALQLRFLDTLTLEEVNQVGKAWVKDDNRVIAVTMPQKPGLSLPTETALQDVVANVAKADIKPYTDTTNDAPLLPVKPAGSKVSRTRTFDGGITEWTLGNGVRVVIKPSDFKKDEIVFTALSPGGSSLASDADYVPADSAAGLIASGGLGNFNGTDLQRKLTGKVAQVAPVIGDYLEGLQGGGSPTDLETLLQLVYLRFTAPRADPAIYQVMMTQLSTMLQNRTANPAAVFEDEFQKMLYDNHPRRQPPNQELLKQSDLLKSLAFYRDRFADAGDFTFIFAGDIDIAKFQPLVETYLGSLPSSGRKESWKDIGIHYSQEVKQATIQRGLDPQSRTRLAFIGSFDVLDPKERTRWSAAADLLQNRLREVLREQLGGTYSISVNRQMSFRPQNSELMMINFGSAPERADELTRAVFTELDKLKQEGPTETELANIKTTMLRDHETRLRQNAYWLSNLQFSYDSGKETGVADMLALPQNVEALTVASLRDAYRRYFDPDHHLRLTLLPEK